MMIKKICVSPDASLIEVMEVIDQGGCKLALVADDELVLLGTISDGDIRRAILAGMSLKEPIENIYCRNPVVATKGTSREELLFLAKKHSVSDIPLVDSSSKVVALERLSELVALKNKSNQVILMVGGLGKRLRPLTDELPKPMLTVGGRPILETIIKRFIECGFTNITLCVNYRSDSIKSYFGNGESLGAKINYVTEQQRMGTAGALTLLNEIPKEPFFVMNGDLLTNANFESMLDFHQENQAVATMGVTQYDLQVPFGVVSLESQNIVSVEEKPIQKFFVSAGIYVLNPSCIDSLPESEFYDMPRLFNNLIENRENVISFPLSEYWLDIGRIEEYEQAEKDYQGVFL